MKELLNKVLEAGVGIDGAKFNGTLYRDSVYLNNNKVEVSKEEYETLMGTKHSLFTRNMVVSNIAIIDEMARRISKEDDLAEIERKLADAHERKRYLDVTLEDLIEMVKAIRFAEIIKGTNRGLIVAEEAQEDFNRYTDFIGA